MASRRDIIQLGTWDRFFFTIALYKEATKLWKLRLGKGRVSYNIGRIAFIFEDLKP